MNEIRENLLREVLAAAGINDDALYTDYLGCGFGFIGNGPRDLARFFIAFVSEASDNVETLIERVDLADDLADAVRFDDGDEGTVFYFPGFTVT